jgi:hypothetical protein
MPKRGQATKLFFKVGRAISSSSFVHEVVLVEFECPPHFKK